MRAAGLVNKATIPFVLLSWTLAAAQSLDGETFAGAFVTMTKGAKCPSTSTIEFVAQAEAAGPISGVANERGSVSLVFDETKNTTRVAALSSDFDINATVKGRLVWEPADRPLTVTCDPLSLRIEGQVTYTITEPFSASGVAALSITAARRGVTGPYFGRSAITFAAK